ncbi:MAG: helix-turn-helix domain-containing protein [Nitrospira sp.]|nr:helix-turn-helix domain-containing protein [Nitrospira sp.]
MEPPLLRVQEAAALLRVSKWTIYRWIEEGRLRASKIGRGSLRIFRASLNGLIDGQRTDQASQGSNGRGQVFRARSSMRASKGRG